MSNSVPVGKKVIFATVLAIVGYLLVALVGFGISENGAVGIALGLFLGVFFADKLLALPLKFAAKPKASASKPTKSAVQKTSSRPASAVGDNEILSIFVGNLAPRVRGRQLAELFEPYGAIESIRIVKNRNTGRGKGFGFVDMKAVSARKAIAELDGTEFFEKTLKISEANAQNNS